MFDMEAPGGVVAGVLGNERALLLLRLVSIDIWLAGWPLLHWKLSEPLMLPMTVEALAGGVGNECARSRGGRDIGGWWEGSGG